MSSGRFGRSNYLLLLLLVTPGSIVFRTHHIHKTLYILQYFFEAYLVLATVFPRMRVVILLMNDTYDCVRASPWKVWSGRTKQLLSISVLG